jgi:hypothetical protein
MDLYNREAQTRLKEKMDYEKWFLDFLFKTQETLGGKRKITQITFRNRQAGANVHLALSDVLGSGAALEVINAMRPLTFVASYKILDMIFEWILEENRDAGTIKRVPWRFSEKIEMFSKLQLDFPPILQSEPYIKDYLFAVYSKLLKFRNEVVHKNNFSVVGDKFTVETIENGHFSILELGPKELWALVKITIVVANLLIGDSAFDPQTDRLLKYCLDRLSKIHGLSEFKQPMPIPVNVLLEVPVENNLFPADLNFVRNQLSRTFPTVDILFNIKIIGLVNDKPTVGWFFPFDSLPECDVLELRPGSHDSYRISFAKEE